LKTRESGLRHKLIASVLAGSMTFAYGGGTTLISIASAAPQAAKPPSLADAKKHYGSGEKKYKAGDAAGALADFQIADSVKSTPQSQRYIGLCQEQLGHLPEAVAAYKNFLAGAPDRMQTEIDDAKARVDKITKLPGHVHIDSTPAGASVAIDGKPQPGVTPLDVDVPPGAHTVTFTLDKYDAKDSNVTVPFAAKASVSETLSAASTVIPPPPPPPPVAVAPAPASTDAPPPPPETHIKAPAYITGGLAIAAAGVGTVFGVLALQDKSNFNKNPTNSTADSGENHALISDMSFFVAVTLGVTSAVLFLTKDDTPAPAAAGAAHKTVAKQKSFTVTPTPIITPNGGGVGALIQF
jgi:tetratricopeptide (TPR) repeat protein